MMVTWKDVKCSEYDNIFADGTWSSWGSESLAGFGHFLDSQSLWTIFNLKPLKYQEFGGHVYSLWKGNLPVSIHN